MNDHLDIDDLKRHLLGKTGGRTEEQLDLAILRNDGSLDPYLSTAIGEIYDDIASGALKKRDQERFLERFPQTPERVAQMRFARSLHDHVNKLDLETAGEKTRARAQSIVSRMVEAFEWGAAPAWRYAVAAVLVASVAVNFWLVTEWPGKGVLVAETMTLKPQSMIQVARPGSEETAVDTTQGLVELKLDIGFQEHVTYEATILREGEKPLWTHRELQAEETGRTTIVKVLLPGDVLESGRYKISLVGVNHDGRREQVESFSFSVN